MMKKVLFLIGISILVLSPMLSYAQEEVDLVTTRKNKLTREYLRPSISTIFLVDDSEIAKKVSEYLEEASISNKFNYNPIYFGMNDDFQNKKIEELSVELEQSLNKNKVGNAIMKNWFPNFSNGSYSTEVLLERGNYASSENDKLRASASHRNKEAILYDLGERLIDRSYVLVFIVSQKAQEGLLKSVVNGKSEESVTVQCLVYKLNFDDAVRETFYQKYFNKADGIEQAEFPVKYVTSAEITRSATSKSVKAMLEETANSLRKMFKKNQEEQEEDPWKRITDDIYYDINVKTAQKVSDFQVKASVAALSPVRAMIGVKEGLSLDDRFDVMELVVDSEGKEKSVRRGAVRVSKRILDNKKDSIQIITDAKGRQIKKLIPPTIDQATQFYQYAGRTHIQEGMALVESPELGFGVAPFLTTNFAGVVVDYRAKMLMTGLSYMLYGGLPLDKDLKPLKPKDNEYGDEHIVTAVAKIGAGVNKEFNFARTFSATAGLGYSLSMIAFNGKLNLSDNTKRAYGFHSLDTFARFGMQVTPNIQVFAQAHYYLYLGDGVKHKDIFAENLSPIGLGLGTKLTF